MSGSGLAQSSVLAYISHRKKPLDPIPKHILEKAIILLPCTCLVSRGQKARHYLAYDLICAIGSHCQLFWLHSLPPPSFTANKRRGTKYLLTQPYMESKSFFSALIRMTAKQMHKASFHKVYFPTPRPSLACP